MKLKAEEVGGGGGDGTERQEEREGRRGRGEKGTHTFLIAHCLNTFTSPWMGGSLRYVQISIASWYRPLLINLQK